MKIFKGFGLFLIVLSPFAAARAQQIKGRVETIAKFPPQIEAGGKCADLKTGKLVAAPQPDYPLEAKTARVGGTIAVSLRLTEKGAFSEILNVSGDNRLQGAAAQAARRVKFSPTACGGSPVISTVVVLYNFIPFAATPDVYFKPAKIEDFADVTKDSQFYEAVLNLTENNKLAYGYADKNFHADAPLLMGDFAEFLRRTLDLLAARARNAGKLPRQIHLFAPLNPQNLKTVDRIKNLDDEDAFAESVKVLLLTYDIALTNETGRITGADALTRAEVVRLWTGVFGAEAVPVNSALAGNFNDERIMTRGEFALFLDESLGVLTYKVLP